jgi:hypothetical protein
MSQLAAGFAFLNGNGTRRAALTRSTLTDQNGNVVNGRICGQRIFGFWDNVANKITFVRKTDPTIPPHFRSTPAISPDPTRHGIAVHAGRHIRSLCRNWSDCPRHGIWMVCDGDVDQLASPVPKVACLRHTGVHSVS